jgi:hypothetical protein
MVEVKDYMAGSKARELFNADEVPNPEFEEESAVYRRGWWDGFNNFDIATAGISFKSKSEDVFAKFLEGLPPTE